MAAGEPVVLAAAPDRFVSRAGHKLEAALERFGVDPSGRVVLDVGSSTGGFTECLLTHDALRVFAVDVGTNQMHERVSGDPRVTLHERTDIRSLERGDLPTGCDLVTVDVSFISLVGLAPHLVTLGGPDGESVVLVKPQFEAPRHDADRGRGVITDPEIWRGTVAGVVAAFGQAGAGMMEVMPSPVRGASGNVEFLVHLRNGAPGRADVTESVGRAIAEVR